MFRIECAIANIIQQLRHVHLVCGQRYPFLSQPSLGTVVGHLTEAPKITRDIKTMTWMFLLEPPPDGTVMLVWQPSQMGASFASDGYVWADAEQAFIEPRDNQGFVRAPISRFKVIN